MTLDCAKQIAMSRGHNYCGSEHLLLALLDERQIGVSRILAACGIDQADLRARVYPVFDNLNPSAQSVEKNQSIAAKLRELAELLEE